MNLKNLFFLFCLAFFSYFQVHALELDVTEEHMLAPFFPRGFYKESEESISRTDDAGVAHDAVKVKFNGGDLVKTFNVDPWELKSDGSHSIRNRGFLVSTGGKIRIMEHEWLREGTSFGQTYLSLKERERPAIVYQLTDPSAEISFPEIAQLLRLTFSIYAEYTGVTINNLTLHLPTQHLPILSHLFEAEIEQGLIFAAPAA